MYWLEHGTLDVYEIGHADALLLQVRATRSHEPKIRAQVLSKTASLAAWMTMPMGSDEKAP